MTIEWIWMIGTVLFVGACLWRFIPLKHIREAWVSFLTMQVLKWLIGTLKTQFNLVESSFRFFPQATRQDFFTDFLIYPCVCVLFVEHFPKNNRMKQFAYTLIYATAIALWNEGLARYTEIQNYIHWSSWYYGVLVFFTLLICKWLTGWFFRRPIREGAARLG